MNEKRLLGPNEISVAIDEIVALAAEERMQIALAGGVALYLAYRSPRLTADVDFVADRIPARRSRLRELSFGGCSIACGNEVEVDFIVRDDDYADLYAAALEHSVSFRGIAAPVVTPEYLVAMKMQAGRDKDHLDLQHLILVGLLDEPLARRVIRDFLGRYAVDEFKSLVEEAKWMASRESPRRRR